MYNVSYSFCYNYLSMRLDYPCLLNAILQITDLTPTEMYKSKASWGLHFHRTLAGSLLVRQKVKQKTF